MKKSNASGFWATLTIFSLMGQIAWVVENMYFNVFIYKIFHASAADISAMVAASAVVAALTSVFMGTLSDKIGKRKIFISGGYILWGISIFAFVFLRTDVIGKHAAFAASAATVGISLTILLDCVMTFFGSTANDAAFNAWLTDSADAKKRGLAEGINAMMPLVSVLVVFGGFMFLDLESPKSWTIIFSVIGTLTLIVGILGIFLIREPDIKPSGSPYLADIVYSFRPKTVRQNVTLYATLAAFVVFSTSIQIFMPYLIIYYEVSLGMADYVLVMAPAIVLAAVATVFFGKFYDKKGFLPAGVTAILLLIAGYILLFFTTAKLPVFLGSLLMMSGYLSGAAVFGAMIRDCTPVGKAGRLQGVRIFAQVLIPGVIGPYIGKSVLASAEIIVGSDGTTSFVPNRNIFLAALVVAVLALPLLPLIRKTVKPRTVSLPTDFENDLAAGEIPYPDYPRPQMRRDSFLNLNGTWAFRIENGKKTTFDGSITVPFVPESRLSGVVRTVRDSDVLVYTRTFTLPDSFMKDRLLLHIGACDQYATVVLNGHTVGEHVGGYLPFSFDVTEYVSDGENTLSVIARDPTSTELPYGKQTKKRGGMWYTKTSGIWQTVWLESVPERFIEAVRITPDLSGVTLQITGGEEEKTLRVDGKTYTFTGDTFRLDVDAPILWTPDNPHLYDFTLTAGEDTVTSYFGLRTFGTVEKDGKTLLALNGEPIFCHGLLDQGYFSDGIFLPASPRGFLEDVTKMKSCGFNVLRKHIKLEPELFYYYCDRHGMLVFQDMINSGKYSFLWDTALPTVFLKKGFTHRATPARREAFLETSAGIQEQLYNHPSVVYYTIFNEGWGQFSAADCYRTLKANDPTRVYDTTSGWFKVPETDVESDHVYFKPVRLQPVSGKPSVLSEFGGYVLKIDGHAFNPDQTYGYRFFSDSGALEDGLVRLYEDEIIPAIENGLSAAILTQVSDVEDETNGLLTYDRKIMKVSAARMQSLADKLHEAFAQKFR